MPRLLSRLLWLLVLLVLAAALYWWWQSRTATSPSSSQTPSPSSLMQEAPESAGTLPAELFAPSSSTLAQEPAPEVLHPIDELPAAAEDTTEDTVLPNGQAFEEQVFGLVGMDLFQHWFLSERLIDRFVATVDNLARAHASPRMWPIPRTPGALETIVIDGRTYVAPSNAARYDGFIQLIEKLPVKSTVDLYKRNYPKFQQSYQSLGYPNAYFNDRLVAVIDHLIATPDVAEPVGVYQVEIKGPLADSHPITHFAYASPQLEQGSAGRKILWRMSPAQRQAVIAKLKVIRQAVAAG